MNIDFANIMTQKNNNPCEIASEAIDPVDIAFVVLDTPISTCEIIMIKQCRYQNQHILYINDADINAVPSAFTILN